MSDENDQWDFSLIEEMEVADTVMKFAAHELGMAILERKDTGQTMAVWPFYIREDDEEVLHFLFKADRIAGKAIADVMRGLERLAEEGTYIRFIPYEETVSLVEAYLNKSKEDGEV